MDHCKGDELIHPTDSMRTETHSIPADASLDFFNHSQIEEEQEDDDSFACFLCKDRFSSMKLFSQHNRNHRQMESNGIKQPSPSQESNSLSEPEITVEGRNDTVSTRNDQNQWSSIDLMKDLPNWSQTDKRGRKSTASDKINDNKIYNPLPLRVNYGSLFPQMDSRFEEQDSSQSWLTMKKQKIEETIPNLSKSSSDHGRILKNPKRSKTVKSTVHQCEICGKMFETGQALGGHKTSHRLKPVVKPFRVELAERKAEEQWSGESGQAREYITRTLFH